MAGLKLIGEYSSGSEDEEKDSSVDDNKKSLNIPALPKYKPVGVGASHHEEVVDEPEEHDGRIRSFKHERGNWATLVYIDYDPSDILMSWMTSVADKIPLSHLNVDDCHLSLTRTLILKYHWIEPFVESIKQLTQTTSTFKLQMTNLRIYCNEERSRTFLGIQCHCLNETLALLVESLNKVLEEYQLPPFYEDASYHISFLWLLGDRENELSKLIPSLNESLIDILSKNFENSWINVREINCKVGNKLYKFKLR